MTVEEFLCSSGRESHFLMVDGREELNLWLFRALTVLITFEFLRLQRDASVTIEGTSCNTASNC